MEQMIPVAIGMVAAYLLGYNAGAHQWRTRFRVLSEYSLQLIKLIEEKGIFAEDPQETK